jgi:hypothetical protein
VKPFVLLGVFVLKTPRLFNTKKNKGFTKYHEEFMIVKLKFLNAMPN